MKHPLSPSPSPLFKATLWALGIALSQACTLSPPTLEPHATTPKTASTTKPDPEKFVQDAYVYHCNDGDTCRVLVANSVWMNVRLAGIDAPEVGKGRKAEGGQPMGDKARERLNALVQNKTVKIWQVDLDHYNRPVVVLEQDGKAINLQMVEEGLAEVYQGNVKRLDKKPYLEAETRAKAAAKGVWALSNYQSPSEFRRARRQ